MSRLTPRLGNRFAQREIKRCAVVDGAFCPDAPTVAVNDALHGGQANARAGKLAHGMETLESAEEPVGIGRIESRAVVTHEVRQGSIATRHPKLDMRGRTLGREFPGVAQQVLQHDPQQTGVRRGARAGPSAGHRRRRRPRR
jgi:hypothetical protein